MKAQKFNQNLRILDTVEVNEIWLHTEVYENRQEGCFSFVSLQTEYQTQERHVYVKLNIRK